MRVRSFLVTADWAHSDDVGRIALGVGLDGALHVKFLPETVFFGVYVEVVISPSDDMNELRVEVGVSGPAEPVARVVDFRQQSPHWSSAVPRERDLVVPVSLPVALEVEAPGEYTLHLDVNGDRLDAISLIVSAEEDAPLA